MTISSSTSCRRTVLGFSNRWYPAAIETAQTYEIAGLDVRVVTPALFIATKLEAFHGRGGGDVFASHNLEDIIAVVDGRPEIVDDVAAAPGDVRGYIGREIQVLLESRDFTEALDLAGFVLPDAASQARPPSRAGSCVVRPLSIDPALNSRACPLAASTEPVT